MIRLKIGDKAPFFSLPNQEGKIIQLSNYFNKRVLIYFYPKAMTPGCTIQACKLRDDIYKFQQMNVEIVGISTDKFEKLLLFAKKEMLNFTLLSDHKHDVVKKFGVWGIKKLMGKTVYSVHRISFLINTKGEIEYIFDKFKTSNHHQIVLNYLNLHS
ncbi:Putative peroxiredoxin bcp [Candidatus Arsenophonus lipoptenae]|uniref:thioredoxin-dependent peroxiredoxin n=1 Tax=Candidatus Arsenophonus lipoptenae TaxID=634113 RepID=A0A0X9VTL7_9GAMM|nr:thioredoxin-dependent thiol peroxidase [Candidatus Arsenophonus lipoptenae]AMA65132.1 Putative peroxiredoxin bcp [Candidatus Arsenophonus lipoptenae]